MGVTVNYNPDILSCLANLSNDEVFTPPELVNRILDMFPAELWSNPNTRVLDPCSKSGVFLREIAKRMIEGEKEAIPDLQERIDHIFHKQLYGIAITELTSLLSRRSLYCSKMANGQYSVSQFKTPGGNIIYRRRQHTWDGDKCIYCGASKAEYDRSSDLESYAYEFIHLTDKETKELSDMHFDLIIGNPPYQLTDGGTGASAKSIYHHFVNQAVKLQPNYLCMIIPARWYANGKGKGVAEFRSYMMTSKKIRELVDFKNSADCFPGVNIAGGVCYFLWDRRWNGKCHVVNYSGSSIVSEGTRNLDEFTLLVRDNVAIQIIRKVMNDSVSMSESVKSYSYFSVRSYERGNTSTTSNVVLLSSEGKAPYDGIYTDRDKIIGDYKVVITYAMSGGNKPSKDGKYQVVSSLQILKPSEICTETYLVLGTFKNEEKANNLLSYVQTNLFRFLMLQALTSIHITKDSFEFVPIQDFTKPWTDEELYKKYGLTDDEITFIESIIRPMDSAEKEA